MLQEGVDPCEGGEEVFVGAQAAFFDDSEVALAGLQKAELVLLCDLAGGLGNDLLEIW